MAGGLVVVSRLIPSIPSLCLGVFIDAHIDISVVIIPPSECSVRRQSRKPRQLVIQPVAGLLLVEKLICSA